MKVRKSAAPFYAVAVIWLAYALLFPLYRVSHFLIVGGISAAAFLVLTALCAKTGVPEGGKAGEAGGEAQRGIHRQCGAGQDAEGRADGHRRDEAPGREH